MREGDYYRVQATQDFNRARRKAFIQNLLALITQRPVDLLSFEEVRERLHLRSRRFRGLQEITLDKIVGSMGRYREFTRTFLPRRGELADRWRKVNQMVKTGGLPPIEVYQVGEVYFVKDGNHRVSVARQSGAPTIEAYVWEFPTKVPLTSETTLDDLIIKEEYLEFLNHTKLNELRPQLRIEFTAPGRYQELESQIAEHRYCLSQSQGRDIPHSEAVADWYDNVYLPAVEAIRRANVMARFFPGRTEADLCIWVFRHQQRLQERYCDQVSAEEATADFVDQHKGPPLERVARRVRRAAERVKRSIEKPTQNEQKSSRPGEQVEP